MRAVLILCLALLSAAPGLSQERSIRELTRLIAKQKEALDPALLEELAAHRNNASFNALEKVLKGIADDALRSAAYVAFLNYREDEKLAARARALLDSEARRAREEAWRLAAVRALLDWGDAALTELEGIAFQHQDSACRTLATDVLAVMLCDRGDGEGLRVVLESASLAQDKGIPYLGIDERRRATVADKTHRAVLRELLTDRLTETTLPIFEKRLTSREASRVWKLVLLRIVAGREWRAASEALAKTCRDRDPAVALLAVELLVEHEGFPRREQVLRPLLRSREPSLRRAAVLALGQVLARDPAFAAEVLGLANSKDAPTRMGAAGALVEVRTPAALEALHELLADPQWGVRVEALQRVGLWRAKESIPVLIERLAAESGRFTADVHAALVAVTRIDLGRHPQPWRQFWEREGEIYEVPADSRAREVVTQKEEGEGERTKVTSFYRLRILSQRVCFVLDVSGSMRNRSQSAVGTIEKSRMDVAKEQLTAVLRGLPDDTLFNVIFFESHLRPLEKKLVKMTKSSRAKALRFVRDQYSVGATALYPALELAFADPLVDTLYLLSDGAPTVGELTDIEEIRAEVARWNSARHVRIHGVAMGQDSTLLRWLCEDSGGTYRRVD